ncbi:MAG: glycoside hydrolase family 5 protein [Ignavibacteria bacterium]|nr:glycoside hydrolase family 5 protein [Ignavibacteria bacterium]
MSFTLTLTISVCYSSDRYSLWLKPSFFRGYNILYESPKTQKDISDFRNYGGNLLQIGTRGFVKEDNPYDTNFINIAGVDSIVKFCRVEGIYYVIAVRSGPGAYDTYYETEGLTPPSRIWDEGNEKERKLYADMLKMIVIRYNEDSLFVGINILVEPRPKVFSVPANFSSLYKSFLEKFYNINMGKVLQYFTDEVRKTDKTIPILIQNFAYSTPELFPAYEVEDPYIVYDVHFYGPYEYTHADKPYSAKYPAYYKSIISLEDEYYNYAFLKNKIFREARNFQLKTGRPFILGEFGIRYPQYGSHLYLHDVMSICLEYGWHFALWDWRRGESEEWNIENFSDTLSWKTVKEFFKR